MAYNVSSGMLNRTVPYHTTGDFSIHCTVLIDIL